MRVVNSYNFNYYDATAPEDVLKSCEQINISNELDNLFRIAGFCIFRDRAGNHMCLVRQKLFLASS